MKEDADDTTKALVDNSLMLKNIDKICDAKRKEYELRCKTRSEELLAIADTIKILNDDDALDLFKKAIPSASFLQVMVTDKEVRHEAIKALSSSQRKGKSLNLQLIVMALHGKKVSFDKVVKMIDDMVVLLGKEQEADETKKEYCEAEFDKADDKKKGLERTISDLGKVIEESKETVTTLTQEITDLEDGIVKLDREIAQATEIRKSEHADFEAQLAANSAAVKLIEFAKNRMQKFYNPKLYKPPPKRELTEEERITLNMGGTLAPTNPPGGIAGTGVTAFEQATSFAQLKAHSDPAYYVMYTPQDAPTPPAAPP